MAATDSRLDNEALQTFIHAPSFRLFYERAFKPKMDEWKKDLCYNVSLTEGQRLGLQYAVAAVEEGIRSAYDNIGATLPEWLLKELGDVNDR